MDRQSVLTVRDQPGHKGVQLCEVATATTSIRPASIWSPTERVLSFLFPPRLDRKISPEDWKISLHYQYRINRHGIEPRKELRGTE